MKKLLIFIAIFMPFFASNAQEANNNMYVYLADGGFDAFQLSDVDSVTYSKIGTDGYEYDDYVVQEVWTVDSVYRFPLSEIDSVGLSTPPTIINSNVFPLTAAHVPYIIRADTLNFTLTKSTPAHLRPAIGNIVAAEMDCTAFPNGIIAKVLDIDETNTGYEYECEKATIDDVYDQIVLYDVFQDTISSDSVTSQNIPQKRISVSHTGNLWNKDFGHTWTYSGTTTTVQANDRAYWSVKLCKTLSRPLTAEISLTNEITSNIDFNAVSEADMTPDPVKIGPTVKAGRISFPHPLLRFIWFEPQISLYGYFEERGSVNLDFAAHFNRTDAITFKYADEKWSFAYTNATDPDLDIASLSMEGSAEVGLQPELLIALNGSATGLGFNCRSGIKQTADFKFDALEAMDTGVYDAMKETTSKTYRTASASVFAQAGFTSKDTERVEHQWAKAEELVCEKYLLPLFEERYQVSDAPNHTVAVTAGRDLIIPVSIDMALYDEEGDLVQQTNDNDEYQGPNAPFWYIFDNVEHGKKYTAYPLVRLGGITMRATPAIPLDYCPAEIKDIKRTATYYDRGAEEPNIMVFSLQAALNDMTDIEEWGVFAYDELMPFESVSSSASEEYYYSIPEYGDEQFRIDYSNFVFEVDGSTSLYVKKRKSDGTTKLLVGPTKEFTLRYDTKPSLIISNPVITGTDIINSKTDDDGNVIYRYKTYCSYTSSVRGTFWIDFVGAGISGGNWHLTDNPSWYPNTDGDYSSSAYSTYWSNSEQLEHTNWRILYLRNNSRTINSNYLNWYGSGGVLTGVSVSSSPANAKQRKVKMQDSEDTEFNYVEVKENIVPLSGQGDSRQWGWKLKHRK